MVMEKKSIPVTLSDQWGGSTLVWLVAIPALLIGLAVLTVIFFEWRKASWDARVREMCAKDGGVAIYETVELSEEEFKRLGGGQGGLPLPSASSKEISYPFFYELVDSSIRESNPSVMRTDMLVIRRSDGKVLGRSIQYFRRGGDFPTGIVEDSAFICPENLQITTQIFRVKGAFK